jgi:glycerate kinase
VRVLRAASPEGSLPSAGSWCRGFDLVADELDLHDLALAADLIITGEGRLDEQSFEGKVVGRVQELADVAGKPVGAVVGDADHEAGERIRHVSLVELFGRERAMAEPMWCVERAAAQLLSELAPTR